MSRRHPHFGDDEDPRPPTDWANAIIWSLLAAGFSTLTIYVILSP